MARNKYNTRPYKKRGLIPRFHLPTRIMTSSRLDPSSLLRPHSPVPSPPLTPAPEPKEDHILFLPRPPYSIIDNPHFHHDVSKSITSYMVRYLDRPQEENFIKAYYQLSPFTITVTTFPPLSPFVRLVSNQTPFAFPFRRPRHLPSHYHASLYLHLPTWFPFILISDSDSLCLPPYLLISDILYDTQTCCGRPFPGLSCI